MKSDDASPACLTQTDWWRRYERTARELAEDDPSIEALVLAAVQQAVDPSLN